VFGARLQVSVMQGGDLCRVNCLASAILLTTHSLSKEKCRHSTQAAEPAYLDPNRNSMQKPVGGLSRTEKRGVGSLLPLFHANSMLKTKANMMGADSQLQQKNYRGTTVLT
jgi:hypothetical protein